MTGRSTTLLFALLVLAHADTLTLRDGTHVTGRWWAVDANQVHFLVNNQLQDYPRSDVSMVTFGAEAVTPAPEPPKQPPAYVPPPPPPPTGTLRLPAARSNPEPDPPTGAVHALEIGPVYFRNDSGDIMPLERTQASAQKRGASQYWEMPATRSRVRLKTAPSLVFVLRLAKGTDPESYSLFPLATANDSRRTKPDPKKKGSPLTLSVDIKNAGENKAGETTYTLTVKDLPPGEYAFSPDGSNDGYCFGIDGAGPGAKQ
jgi:hypothetical protein